jgi:hypothetical protein
MVKEASDRPVERPVLRAILNAKKKFGPLLKDKNNPFYKSKYADLAALMDVVEGPLLEEDVVILQPTIVKPEGQYVRTRLVHVPSGDEEPGELKLPDNLDAQKIVAAITYYKRATLQSLLSIPSRDDDGETANGRGDYDPSHPTATPRKPATASVGTGASNVVIPGFGKQPKPKGEAKAPAGKDDGIASVTIQSIAPGDHPTVKFSKLVTSGGLFIVMGDSPKFTDAMKAAQLAALNKSTVVIEYHVNAKGSNIVDILRVEE